MNPENQQRSRDPIPAASGATRRLIVDGAKHHPGLDARPPVATSIARAGDTKERW
jgi:hypothetical protein